MKNKNIRLSILTAATILGLSIHPASALDTEELAGVYQGTSTATLASGQSATADVTITFQPNKKVVVLATVNGQTSKSKGKFQFASDDVIVGSFKTGEFTAFVSVEGNTLTFTLLVHSDAAGFITERTTATLVQKL